MRQPRLEQLVALAETFDVSKDAIARAFAEYHDEPVAVLIWRDGRLVRCYRSATMPWLGVRIGDQASRHQLPEHSLTGRRTSEPAAVEPETWLDDRSARLVLELTQQQMSLREGLVLQMLHAELRDEDEPGDHDAHEMWRPRF